LYDDKVGDEVFIFGASLMIIPGGLGLSTPAVGIVMSLIGVIAFVIHNFVCPLFASWLGVWRYLTMVTLLHSIAFLIVPCLAPLLKNLLYPGIWACFSIRNSTSILTCPLILITLKEAAPSPSFLGKIDGLAASVRATSRTIDPLFGGYLYGVGARLGFTGGHGGLVASSRSLA